ncbi:hypothetical protein NE865_04887 [Phthorimaea operculella]|nr:hypothetical protein NE865_04887 [Phthorimaea operculella]
MGRAFGSMPARTLRHVVMALVSAALVAGSGEWTEDAEDLGHVYRMEPSRLPRRVLLGAVANAKRGVGRPMLRFTDCAKRDMAAFDIDHQSWEKFAENRDVWRKRVFDGRKAHDDAWFAGLANERQKRHLNMHVPVSNSTFVCRACGKSCRSRIGLYSHEKSCIRH